MVERQFSKLLTRVRFPSPAPSLKIQVTSKVRLAKTIQIILTDINFMITRRGLRIFLLVAVGWLGTNLPAEETKEASLAFVSNDASVRESRRLLELGKFKEAEILLAASPSVPVSPVRQEMLELICRTRYEYSLDAAHLLQKIQKSIPDATAEEVEWWAKSSGARFRMIDGEKLYFRREPRNIFLFCKEAEARAIRAGHPPTPESKTRNQDHLKAIVNEAERTGKTEVQPVRFRFTQTITLHTNLAKVKAGSIVRAWLPFPQEYRQQKDVKLISAKPEPKLIAPGGVDGKTITGGAQRSVYLEQRVADPAKPIEFKEVFEYTFYAYYPQIDEAKVQPLPADWNGACLGERLPHIVFTPAIREQVAKIVGTETNAFAKARKIFHWVSDNVPWCAEDEYCLIPSFAIKGFTARQGDCGVQNTVFITMCRTAGIPARWQSGFETKPFDDWGMHDWAEIYLAPWGWLPADASYGVQESKDPRIADFFLGHQDSYRLIVNLDWGRELFPPKKSFRSEPADFQRGEVEVDGQNLYFDQWDAKSEVERMPLTNP